MAYEFKIGWRYLYRGSSSPEVVRGFIISALLTLAGAAWFIASDAASGFALITLVAGMLSTVLFALLYFFSVFTTVSVLGVVLGVAALTVVLAVTTGFQQAFREKVLGVNAHVIITKNTTDFSEYRKVERIARDVDPEVVAVQPFIFVEMLATRGQGVSSGVAVKGIPPDRERQVLNLHEHMIEGNIEVLIDRPLDGPAPIILGKGLAEKLDAKVGDDVTVVAPLSNVDVTTWTSTGEGPKSKEFIVKGIFYSGFAEYDGRLMYAHLSEVQELMGRGDRVLGVEMRVSDVDRADEIARKVEAALGGGPYIVQDWHELNKNLFTALFLQKLALLIILTLIVAVAAFNMVSALTMMVIDKTREIAILKSMGSTKGGIASIFVTVGLVIGGIGNVFGLAIGLVICKAVASYDYDLDPKVYLIDKLPISVSTTEVILVGSITILISLIATLMPSIKASELRPVAGLRYD